MRATTVAAFRDYTPTEWWTLLRNKGGELTQVLWQLEAEANKYKNKGASVPAEISKAIEIKIGQINEIEAEIALWYQISQSPNPNLDNKFRKRRYLLSLSGNQSPVPEHEIIGSRDMEYLDQWEKSQKTQSELNRVVLESNANTLKKKATVAVIVVGAFSFFAGYKVAKSLAKDK